jgi:hypothetical protein
MANLTNLLNEILHNADSASDMLLEFKYFIKMTHVIANKSDNLNDIDNAMTIIIILFTHTTDYNKSIKIINAIYQSKLFDHIAKNICGKVIYINIFRNLLASLVTLWNNLKLTDLNKIIFAKCLERLLLKSLWTRHMFLSILNIDILALSTIQDANYTYIKSRKEIEISDLNIIITTNTPDYIRDWYGTTNDHIIFVTYLGLLPRIVAEIDNHKILKHMCRKIEKTLILCKTEIKSKLL